MALADLMKAYGDNKGAIGNLVNLGVSAYGAHQVKNQENTGLQQYQQALDDLRNLYPPEMQELVTELQDYVVQGQITPEQYTTILQQESQMAGVKVPPEIEKQQYDTLAQLSNIVAEGGQDASFRAAMNDVKDKLQNQIKANTESLKNEFARRGQSGSGLEFAARAQGGSDAIQAASKQGFDAAAEGQRRAYQAIMDKGTLAGNIRTQDVGEQERKAQAADTVNRFNTTAKQNVSDANVKAANDAQAANLAEQQRIADANVKNHNQESENRSNAVQQTYQNNLNRVQGIATAQNGLGNQQLHQAERTENQYSNLGKTLGSAISGSKTTPAAATSTPGGLSGGLSDEELKAEAKRRGFGGYL